MIYDIYLSLGSNSGDREKNLARAIDCISSSDGLHLNAVSDIYETEPVRYTNQEKFLNMAAAIRTSLEPATLLERLQEIEALLGRTREIHWGPRTIDIDILLYENKTIDLPQLKIPHPRMFERAFVLVPLRDIYPCECINGVSIEHLIGGCTDKDGIRPYRNMSSLL